MLGAYHASEITYAFGDASTMKSHLLKAQLDFLERAVQARRRASQDR